jgi:N-dimethylarginine dimethylaminohydrolase
VDCALQPNGAMGSAALHFLVSKPCCAQPCGRSGDDECSFRVAWSINPHMQVGAVRPHRAVSQHSRFVRTLRALGATVQLLPFVHGAYDSVFSKDNAVLVQRPDGRVEALLARPRHAERHSEQNARATAYAALGITTNDDAGAHLEGGDVVVLDGARHAFLGYGFRSEGGARRGLARFLDCDVTCLELRDPRLYHLDMALSILDDGTAVVCPDALSPRAMRALERHPLVRSLVHVPIGEALAFGVNLVQLRDTVITAATATTMARALRARGYAVKRVFLDQFHLAGGSAACLVSRVHVQAHEVSARSPRSSPGQRFVATSPTAAILSTSA